MKSIKKQTLFKYFFHIVVPIIVGIFIYSAWRGINFIDPVHSVFPFIVTYQPPYWVLYNLPDGLWLYALLSTIFFIWEEKFSIHLFIWLLLAIILSYLLEISQAFHLIPGTFDRKDLLAYLIAMFCYYFNHINKKLLIKYINKKK